MNSTSYLHQADLFRSAPITGSRTAAHGHQFQVLQFGVDGRLLDLDCSASKRVTIDIAEGVLQDSTTGNTSTDNSPHPESTPYTPACILPTYQLYQTFAPSKSGSLKSIGVNVASLGPVVTGEEGNLTITVFRYKNNTNFYTPFYVWETLATLSIPPSEISQSFEVLDLSVNQPITSGEKLGIALVSAAVSPLCVMVTAPIIAARGSEGAWKVGNFGGEKVDGTGELVLKIGGGVVEGERELFAIGLNQVSLRGSAGTTSPVGTFGEGREIKWSAVIE